MLSRVVSYLYSFGCGVLKNLESVISVHLPLYCFTGDGDSAVSASRGSRQWRKADDRRWGAERRAGHFCSSCFSRASHRHHWVAPRPSSRRLRLLSGGDYRQEGPRRIAPPLRRPGPGRRRRRYQPAGDRLSRGKPFGFAGFETTSSHQFLRKYNIVGNYFAANEFSLGNN